LALHSFPTRRSSDLTARSAYSSCKRVSALRSSCAEGARCSSKSSRMRSRLSGLPAACSTASRIRSSAGCDICPYLDVNGCKGLALHQIDQLFLDQLEYRHEGHHHSEPPLLGSEEAAEGHELAALEPLQYLCHALSGRQCLATDLMTFEHVGPTQHLGQRQQQLLHAHRRMGGPRLQGRRRSAGQGDIPTHSRQLVQLLG